MSTKIYDGFRFVPSDLAEIHGLLMGYRPAVKRAVHEAKCRFLAEAAAKRIDGAALGGPGEAHPLSAACDELRERQKKVRETGLRDPAIDFDFKLAVMPYDGLVYGIAYCDQPGWKAALLAQPWVHPWPYWNGSDGPDDLSEAEWEARGETWDAILAGDEWGRPVGCGFGYDFEPPNVSPDAEAVLAFLPSHEKRVARWATNFVCDAQFRRLCGERGVEPGSRGSISLAIAAGDFARGEEGAQARETEARRIAPLLPTIDITGLLGWTPTPSPRPQSPTAEETLTMASLDLTEHERRLLGYLDQRGPSHRSRVVFDLAASDTKFGRAREAGGALGGGGSNNGEPMIMARWCRRLIRAGLVSVNSSGDGYYQNHAITMAGRHKLRTSTLPSGGEG